MAHSHFRPDRESSSSFKDSPDNVESEDDPCAQPEIDRYVHNLHAADQYSNHCINLFREDLRAILFNSITKDTVQWPGGRTLAVKSVVLSDIQQHTLTFTDDSLLSVLPVMAPGSSFVFIP